MVSQNDTRGKMGIRQSLALRSLSVLGVLLFGAAPQVDPADLVLRNGKVVTVDEKNPVAQAIAVRGDAIVAVGSNKEIEQYVGDRTHVIDLGGKLVVPGFIEGHGHFTGIGASKMNLDLMKVKNWDEVVEMVAAAVKQAKPGDWILGRGWHQEKWDKRPGPHVEGFPLHESLSKVSPNNPIILTHASGHASFVNGKALEISGITKSTKNPVGGEILKDKEGNPAGVLRETAQGLVRRALTEARSKRSPEEKETMDRREIELAMQECLSKGITSFQDAGSSFGIIDLLKKFVDEGNLRLRLWVMIRESNDLLAKNLAQYKIIGYGDNRLTVRAIKKSIDGALGSRGAWLLEPYTDSPSSTGLNTIPVPEMMMTAKLAIEHDYQFCVHAIGDRANRETLNIFEQVFGQYPNKKELRWRVEHAQHLSTQDIPRFGKLAVVASMQGIHCTSDAPYVIARLGAQRAEEGAYVWQKLMKTGAVILNGTDAPVEDVDPLASFYASVTRKLKDGSVFYGGQKMSREEALKSYTLNAAYGAFEENIKGSLTPGKLADMTVLSKDIMTIPEDEIPSAHIEYTIVGGKIMFQK